MIKLAKSESRWEVQCKITAETKKEKKINGEILMKIKFRWNEIMCKSLGEKYISKYDLRDISVPWLHI